MNAAATLRILVASGWLLSAVGASAQLFNFSTPAGLASAGSADGAVTNSQFSSPSAIAGDSAGNLFVADNANHVIRKISTNGTVVTIAGTAGVSGSGDGTGAAARFHSPMGITVNAAGTNVFVADTANHAIRKLAYNGTNWIVSTFAGLAGAGGTANGSGGSARFFAPEGLALDAAGNLFVADTWNHSIRKITPAGTVSTYAGTAGTNGTTDGAALTAQFYQPQAVALDAAGNVFVADTANHTVRKIATGGTVTTVL